LQGSFFGKKFESFFDRHGERSAFGEILFLGFEARVFDEAFGGYWK
jgi:hypothetical protein